MAEQSDERRVGALEFANELGWPVIKVAGLMRRGRFPEPTGTRRDAQGRTRSTWAASQVEGYKAFLATPEGQASLKPSPKAVRLSLELEGYLGIGEFAKTMGFSRAALYNRMREAGFPEPVTTEGRPRWTVAQVEEYKASHPGKRRVAADVNPVGIVGAAEAAGREVEMYQWLGGIRMFGFGETAYLCDGRNVWHSEEDEWVRVNPSSVACREVMELYASEAARVIAECPVGSYLQSYRLTDIESLSIREDVAGGVAVCALCCELLGKVFENLPVSKRGNWRRCPESFLVSA